MPTDPSIPMSSPDLTDAEVAAVHEVVSTRYLSLGPKLEACERSVASYVGAAHGVGVNSGTSGLHLCVIAAGVGGAGSGAGDLVITTPFSFVASANCILYERGMPIFVDVERRTGNIDPSLVAESVHDLRRGGPAARRWLPRKGSPLPRAGEGAGVRAILPVHAFGRPYTVDITVHGTQGRTGVVRTAWLVTLGADEARLITLWVRR